MSITFVPAPSADAPVPQADEDAALAAALLARAPGAADQAWNRFSPLVLGFLRRYFGPRADHEDLCQEVFARFFARIAELRVPQALRGFLIGICMGVAQNERRRAHVRRVIALTPTGDLPEYPGAAADLDAREAVGRLERILAQAGDHDRVLFVSRFIEDNPLGEIARDTGRPVGTVKRHVATARRRFASKLRHDPALAPYVDGWLPPPPRPRLAEAA